MAPSGFSILLRFWVGTAGSIAIGLLAFGRLIFDPTRPSVQCITVGLLVAGVLTTVRIGSYRAALALVLVFSLVRLGTAQTAGWGFAAQSALSALLLGLGVVLIAILYDLLARSGVRFGKFFLVGPLLSMLLIALAPLTHFHAMNFADPTSTWLFDAYLGLLIGDGAAFGVELTELLTTSAPTPEVQTRASGEAA